MTGEYVGGRDLSRVGNEVVITPIFTHSWLDVNIQQALVQEIAAKASTANVDQLYVIYSNHFYPNSVNCPFEITAQKPRLSGHTNNFGPFEPKVACAIAYLEQEGRILCASKRGTDLNPVFKKAGITSVQGVGQGVGLFASNINACKNEESTLSIEALVDLVISSNEPRLEKQIADRKSRYENGQRHFGYTEISTSYYDWKASEDEQKGFYWAKLLFAELVQYYSTALVQPPSGR